MPATAVRVALMCVVIPIATAVRRAQQSGPPLAALEHATWTIRDGAPSGVRALAQSADGALWIGATTGLYRFDGLQFEPFEAPDGQSLPSLAVSALLALPDGNLWIGYRWGAASPLARRDLPELQHGASWNACRPARFSALDEQPITRCRDRVRSRTPTASPVLRD